MSTAHRRQVELPARVKRKQHSKNACASSPIASSGPQLSVNDHAGVAHRALLPACAAKHCCYLEESPTSTEPSSEWTMIRPNHTDCSLTSYQSPFWLCTRRAPSLPASVWCADLASLTPRVLASHSLAMSHFSSVDYAAIQSASFFVGSTQMTRALLLATTAIAMFPFRRFNAQPPIGFVNQQFHCVRRGGPKLWRHLCRTPETG